MDKVLKRLLELEAQIAYHDSPAPGEEDFDYRPGHLPVLLTAPHGAVHCRNGRWKEEDEFTSGLALLLAELTGAQALYVHHRSNTDHNYYRETPFKQRIRAICDEGLVRFILDLHGASDHHPFAIALGMMGGQSCPDQADLVQQTLARYGFDPLAAEAATRLDVDNAFKGGGGDHQETVTAFAARCLNVPAAQLELTARVRIIFRAPNGARHRPYQGDLQSISRTITALSDLVVRLSETPF